MKHRYSLIAIAALFMLGGTSHGATITYTPSSAELAIPAGASKSVVDTLAIENIDPQLTYYTWFIDTVNGNLPKAWITVAPAAAFLSATASSRGAIYTVAVPEGTPAGTYRGTVYGKAKSAHRTADPGTGITLQVTVPPVCSGIPKLVGVAVNPDVIWPPNHKMDVVTVTGKVAYPGGCKLINFGYNIEDEYDIYTETGSATVGADSAFSFTLPVEASRDGQDKDGRHYRITVYAENEAGIGMSEVLTVVVPHDQGKK